MSLITNEDIAILKSSKLYQDIGSDLLFKSIEGSHVKKLQRKEALYVVGNEIESFAIVLSGALKLLRPTIGGENIIVHITTTGELIGGLLMTQKNISTYPISAIAMVPSRVLCIPRSTFYNTWEKELLFQTKLATIMYKRLSNLQDDKTFFSAPLKIRLVRMLARYLDQSSSEMPRALILPLTRQELADSLGVAVESVIRIMSDWSHQGMIRTNDKVIEIVDFEELIKTTDS